MALFPDICPVVLLKGSQTSIMQGFNLKIKKIHNGLPPPPLRHSPPKNRKEWDYMDFWLLFLPACFKLYASCIEWVILIAHWSYEALTPVKQI